LPPKTTEAVTQLKMVVSPGRDHALNLHEALITQSRR
jgi:hypothetical protein